MVKVAVIGCGLMGIRIAGEMAYHGHRVTVYDRNESALECVNENLAVDKSELKEEGLMTHPNFLGQVLCMSELKDTVKEADFIFEVVVENTDVKQELFEKISQLCSEEAIIATNSLNLDIGVISERSTNPERIMGLRFLHPVYAIPEVEIRTSLKTSPQYIEKVRKFLERMGKTLFFRSGKDPLILSEAQIYSRKHARREEIRRQRGLLSFEDNGVPQLGHMGNLPSLQDDDCAIRNDRDCAICMDRSRNCLLCPCHHMITCMECAKSLVNRKDYCPICRKSIKEVIRVFHS